MAAAVASSLKESSLFWIRRVVLGLEGADYGLAWNHLSVNLLASGVIEILVSTLRQGIVFIVGTRM
jgi:hypothetical protein